MAVLLLTINAFKSSKCSKSDLVGSFTVQLNPTGYTKAWQRKEPIPATTLANGLKISMTPPPDAEEIDLSFTLDDTGAIPGNSNIVDSIKSLKALCIDVNSSTHTTNWLKLIWGSLQLTCKMDSLSVNYTLFDFMGFPIRAVLTAHFKEVVDLDQKLGKLNSPDMSHLIEIKEGDNLPLMCEDIYGDSSFYLQVAAANDIVDFRNLVPGQQILFPRLEK
jgi:hypothetical protein